jgi:hypothetical protein
VDGIEQRQAVELIPEGERAQLRRIKRQQELTVADQAEAEVADDQRLGARQLDDDVGALLAHVGADVGGRLEPVAQQLQLRVAVEVVDRVAAVAGLDLVGRALLVGRAHQHVVAGPAVHPLGAVNDDQVVQGVADRES